MFNNEDAGFSEEEFSQLLEDVRSVAQKSGKLDKLEGDIDKLFTAVRKFQQDGATPSGQSAVKKTLGARMAADGLAQQIVEGAVAAAKKTYKKTSLLAQKRALTSASVDLDKKTYDDEIAYSDVQRPPSILSLFRRMPTTEKSISYFERTRLHHLWTRLGVAASTGDSTITLLKTDNEGTGAAGLVAGYVLTLSQGLAAEEEATIASIDYDTNVVTLTAPLANNHALKAEVVSDKFAFTPECEIKVQANLEYEEKEVTAKTHAVFLRLCNQVLSDSPRLQAEIDAELPDMLERMLECQILYGNGSTREFAGIWPNQNVPSIVWSTSPIGTSKLDLIRLAIAQEAKINRMPEWIILHPCDMADIELTKGDDGQYVAHFTMTMENGQMRVWRLPVFESNAINQGEFLVGSSRGATIYDREEVDIEMSEHDRDNFVKNMVTIRGEQRLAFAVKEPQAFVKGFFDSKPV